MLRSLYSGVSGMKNLQNELDVVANNIANVNTIGFKSSRVNFQDIMSQNMRPAAAGNNAAGGLGGTNPMQIGLGVTTASVDTMMGNGAQQTTGNGLDVYLDGPGFLVMQDTSGSQMYTRAGALQVDANGYLVNNSGVKVMGAANVTVKDDSTAPNLGTTLTSIKIPATATVKGATVNATGTPEIGADGVITQSYGGTKIAVGRIAVANFTNPNGLAKAGGTNFTASPNSGDPVISNAAASGVAVVRSGALEMSNVDLSTEFTNMIVASRAYQANAKSITTSDEILQTLISLKQ
ncbi:flagellar hook-basal body complex protein [Periweissella ghanensis]|uniref:Flagellar hook protein FlgE n=1 Tax=Periweissella ghanensis TaxID=467997 RepID=A0ABM8Z962_9LACO|nr:flagellar hook-basal body complex protein [Periweissella ghanensis]MCM0601030.1 flagellar hook-basal body complex protein [Periweissella ghanensis]CAH0417889.1 Flagellar basal-body rod protein FlgG [Periweissella ghanensis]